MKAVLETSTQADRQNASYVRTLSDLFLLIRFHVDFTVIRSNEASVDFIDGHYADSVEGFSLCLEMLSLLPSPNHQLEEALKANLEIALKGIEEEKEARRRSVTLLKPEFFVLV